MRILLVEQILVGICHALHSRSMIAPFGRGALDYRKARYAARVAAATMQMFNPMQE